MMLLSNEKSVIALDELDAHTMNKYSFKTIAESSVKSQNLNAESRQKSTDSAPKVAESTIDSTKDSTFAPSKAQVAMIESSLEKELIDKLLQKSDDLSATLKGFEKRFSDLQAQANEREKVAKEEGIKEGKMMVDLELKNSIEIEREKIASSINKLDSAIDGAKAQIEKLESELSSIALDIAKEVIIKEISAESAKVAASIAKELLKSMSGNLDVVIKVNPADFEFLNNLAKGKENIKIKSDDAIAKGGVVIISENGNIDGSIMSRYKLLKQSVIENLKGF
ncbi:flagellar assembly protein FliH [Helicobacter sp. 23-1044]